MAPSFVNWDHIQGLVPKNLAPMSLPDSRVPMMVGTSLAGIWAAVIARFGALPEPAVVVVPRAGVRGNGVCQLGSRVGSRLSPVLDKRS